MAKLYNVREVTVTEQVRGTRIKDVVREQVRVKERKGVMKKECLANYIPGLHEATIIIHLGSTDAKGKRVSYETRLKVIQHLTEKYGSWCLYTQSGVRGRGGATFVFVKDEMVERLIDSLGVDRETGLGEFGAYIGNLFSETTDGTYFTVDDDRAPKDTGGLPVAIAKGIFGPMKGAGFRLDDTQVKLGKQWAMGSPLDHGDGNALIDSDLWKYNFAAQFRAMLMDGKWHVLRNEGVTARKGRQWISWEPIVVGLTRNGQTRDYVWERVQNEVAERLNMMKDDHRAEWFTRLGAMSYYEEFGTTQRAMLEYLLCNVPMCAEVEKRAERYIVREVLHKIVPSCGMWGWRSLIWVSEEYGADAVDRKDAKTISTRMPVASQHAMVPLPVKTPKKLGWVVKPEIAKRQQGDSDGDSSVGQREDDLRVFQWHPLRQMEDGTAQKDTKVRIAAPLNKTSFAIKTNDIIEATKWVGLLTDLGLRACQQGDWEIAKDAFAMANQAPMLIKWDISYNGESFTKAASNLLRFAALGRIKIQWREMAERADKELYGGEVAAIRQLANDEWEIPNPKSLMDDAWRAAHDMVKKWVYGDPENPDDEGNPAQPWPEGQMADRAEAFCKGHVPTWAMARAREVWRQWFEYWENAPRDKDGNLIGENTSIFETIQTLGEEAEVETIAAAFYMNFSFAFIWHFCFASGRAHQVLGIHPDIQNALTARKLRKG